MKTESIKIIIEAEGLSRALTKFAEALTQQNLNFIDLKNVTQSNTAEAAEENKKNLTEQDNVGEYVTIEEVRKILATKSKNGKQAEVKELIKRYGVNKLTDIHKCNYKEILELAETL